MADRSSIGDRIAEIESRKGRWAWQATEDIEFLLAEIERLRAENGQLRGEAAERTLRDARLI